MNGYKDTAALAEECEKQYRVLKGKREEQERLERERRQREKEERERREAEERERIAPLWQNPAKAGERQVLSIKNVDYAFRWCPFGTFTMGSPASEAERYNGETQHKVALSRGFWLLETPVTQGLWESVMGNNPSHFKGSKNLPVESVSWDDCQGFIRKLNGLNIAPSGYRFSLPTEGQWEYACRAGTTTPFHFGSVLNGDKANCNGNYPYGTSTKGQYLKKTSEVGSYPANAWGLYDMHGNVWEWCSDGYGDYPSGSVTDPVGASSGSSRVLRGGGWGVHAGFCRSAYRSGDDPSSRDDFIGVRLYVATSPVDMRKSFDGLAAIVKNCFKKNPLVPD